MKYWEKVKNQLFAESGGDSYFKIITENDDYHLFEWGSTKSDGELEKEYYCLINKATGNLYVWSVSKNEIWKARVENLRFGVNIKNKWNLDIWRKLPINCPESTDNIDEIVTDLRINLL